MAKPKNSGLGRGLDAIFVENSVEEGSNVTMLRLSEIEPNPNQPRREFDAEALSQLADSIVANGLIQPIVVRSANAEGYYQIIAGERRWRASKMAGLTEVPVIVMELDDKKAAQIALIENIQREDLNPVEEATAYKTLMTDYNMTQEELSRQVGKSRPAVANSLRILELPADVLELVKKGSLSFGHAKVLLSLINRNMAMQCAEQIISKNLSVRDTEKMVKSLNCPRKTEEKPKDSTEVDYTSLLAGKMTEKLGHRVRIQNTEGKRKIEILFSDNDELNDIVTSLCGENIFDD